VRRLPASRRSGTVGEGHALDAAAFVAREDDEVGRLGSAVSSPLSAARQALFVSVLDCDDAPIGVSGQTWAAQLSERSRQTEALRCSEEKRVKGRPARGSRRSDQRRRLTSETTAFFGPAFELPQGLAFVADNVILLRYAELESEVRRVLAVVKLRDGDHTKNLLEVEITKNGMTVIGKFSGLTGVLGGNPTLTPPPGAQPPAVS
jgi:hypothetical protein